MGDRRPGFELDDLTRPTDTRWPRTRSGPETIITDEDLRTAFFLPDTGFGPPGALDDPDFAPVPRGGAGTGAKSGPPDASRSGPSTVARSGPSTVARSGPTTTVRTEPTTIVRGDPTTQVRVDPTTTVRAEPPTTIVRAGPPTTIVRTGPPTTIVRTPREGGTTASGGLRLRPEGPPTRLFDEDGEPLIDLRNRQSAEDAQPPRRSPTRPAAAVPAEPAIDYFGTRGARSRGLGLALSPTAWVAAAALSVLLVLQAIVGWRDGLAARVPGVGAVLSAVGLGISPPRDLNSLTIESFELQAGASPQVLQLSAVLRNGSGHAVGFPAMELTLTDSAGALLVRKVIPAEAYLGDPSSAASGLAARSERPLRLALEHGGLQPTGYSVALFYP